MRRLSLGSLFISWGKVVFRVIVGGGINCRLYAGSWLRVLLVWVSGLVLPRFYQSYTSVFALLFREVFNPLDDGFMHAFHTTYKYNNKLYKLIIIAN